MIIIELSDRTSTVEIRQLRTFCKLAQTLSFSGTAVSLNYAQSTVSAQIQALEKELNVALFDRLGKRVVLTAAGKRLLAYAEQVVALESEARLVLSEQETLVGSLTISAPETLCTYRLPPILHQFRAEFPQIKLTFHPKPSTGLLKHIREGMIDVAFVMEEPFQAPDLVVESLITDPLLLVARPDHLLAQSSAIGFEALQNEPMVLTEATCGYRLLFEKVLTTAGVRLGQPMEFHSVEAIKQCVMAGIGISLLPAVAVATELRQGRLIALPWRGPELQVVTQMIRHKNKWLSPALRTFLSVVKESFREQ